MTSSVNSSQVRSSGFSAPAQPFRLDCGIVDRNVPLGFKFNGKSMTGYHGDTLASALLANGVRFVGRSFKYHRPRGIFSSGPEEPNALVELGADDRREPNTRATVTELFEGLAARSQNHRGSLEFDLLAINDYFSSFLSAGFYYKTFMWPKSFWEKIYEPTIRKAAGLGSLSMKPDPAIYDKGFLHCDVLVIGAGAAGLAAALTAGRSGAKVIIADQDFRLGGRLLSETHEIDGMPARRWADDALNELASLENVRILSRTTVYGAFDHGIYGALEQCSSVSGDPDKPRQILWRIYARRAILCAGAIERPIAFGNNDRPGVMLAGSVRTYLNRYGVRPGNRVAVFTNNDDGWRTAYDLVDLGVNVAAIIDSRTDTRLDCPTARVITGATVLDTSGRKGLTSITLSTGEKIRTDCLAVSGGWNPDVHISCHHRGRPVWSNSIAAFVPGADVPAGMLVAGAAAGRLTLAEALSDGDSSATQIVSELGLKPKTKKAPIASDEKVSITALWHVSSKKSRVWLDQQNDVTTKDVLQAHQEGFRSVEHVKRYTTLGMATDQGKTANVLAMAVLAEAEGTSIPQIGTTIYRPPYTPVSIGALAGRSRGKHFRPTRLTPSHEWALEQNAAFVEAGMWLRAQWFPRDGETHWRQSVDREVMTTRSKVGVCDVTTLGKIDVKGSDAATFLSRIYANSFVKLKVGRVRYGLMLREDGIAYDDGTAARLAENHFVITTTTANAVTVFRNMEFARQCLWPDMDVHLTSITDGAAQFAIAGPHSRRLLTKVVDAQHDISNSAMPFMACAEISVCGGIPARLFRISFSGELAFEISLPARYGDSFIRTIMAAGTEFGVCPYGTEALGVMRIEKGHAAGNELNGQTTANMLGLGKVVSRKKDCIGNVMSRREHLERSDQLHMMGFVPIDTSHNLTAGSHFFTSSTKPEVANDQGWMSSVAFSPILQHSIGLGFIKRGNLRKGEIVKAYDPLRGNNTRVRIVSPHFVDPEGDRLRE